jgi:Ca2+-binding EF-hand superfamily protein
MYSVLEREHGITAE